MPPQYATPRSLFLRYAMALEKDIGILPLRQPIETEHMLLTAVYCQLLRSRAAITEIRHYAFSWRDRQLAFLPPLSPLRH